ncbi:hypothetical protein EYF80_001397 [Liparis tanakae]|uniref:Uncharacterized protein n=1 Tax=Liparis tanakae TaxID=230148 RepID=A0A4Z2JDT4_9TELE|nr:hypothetical protein EYF80_001397 [Liparis tanakae]
MSCQPAARTPKPLSHRLEQGSRAVKHTPADNPKQLQMRLKSLLRGKQTCVWAIRHSIGGFHITACPLPLDIEEEVLGLENQNKQQE